ncbi:MAG: flippase-like domain-containing protein [Saprospiraceae bacterium]|nr:MAG: integral membrane protein [Bacteroidetes bacterium OLB9]MCO6463927.1 flippase-like domain-containing protein [Saprospiraceae bacterium]MCZ2338587.1 flippase-like domain-containing protein [Chitinophagales bacterium]
MSERKINLRKTVNRLILLISLGIAAHIIFVLSTTEKSLLSYLNRLDVWHVLIIMGLLFTPWSLYALRVYIWSKFLGEKITYRDLLRIVITSEMASAVSPPAVGGAPVKAALLLNYGFSAGSAGFLLAYGVIEDIIFYATGILFATFLSIGVISDIKIAVGSFVSAHAMWMLIVIGILIVYISLLKSGRMPRQLKLTNYFSVGMKRKLVQFQSKLNEAFTDLRANFKIALQSGKLVMLVSISLLFLQWMARFSILLVILHAFGIDFDAIQMYLRQWIVYVTMLFIPTPGATGGAEAFFLLIFGHSIPKDISFLIVSLWRFCTYYLVLMMAVILYNVISFFFKPTDEIVIEEKD